MKLAQKKNTQWKSKVIMIHVSQNETTAVGRGINTHAHAMCVEELERDGYPKQSLYALESSEKVKSGMGSMG